MFRRTFSLSDSLSTIGGSSSAESFNISQSPASSSPISSSDALYEELSAVRNSLWQVESLDEDTVKAALVRLLALEATVENDEHLRNKNSWLQKVWVLRSACLLKEAALADEISDKRCKDAYNLLEKALVLEDTGSDALMRFKEPLKVLSEHMYFIALLDSIQVTHIERATLASCKRMKRFEIKKEAAIQEGRLIEAEKYAIHSKRVRVPELPLRMSAGLTLFAQKDCFQDAYAYVESELPEMANRLLCLALSKDRHSEARRVISPR